MDAAKLVCWFADMKIIVADALDLPVSERIQLVAEASESIAACPEEVELTEATRELLRQRWAAHRPNPDDGSAWEEVRKRIVSRCAIASW